MPSKSPSLMHRESTNPQAIETTCRKESYGQSHQSRHMFQLSSCFIGDGQYATSAHRCSRCKNHIGFAIASAGHNDPISRYIATKACEIAAEEISRGMHVGKVLQSVQREISAICNMASTRQNNLSFLSAVCTDNMIEVMWYGDVFLARLRNGRFEPIADQTGKENQHYNTLSTIPAPCFVRRELRQGDFIVGGTSELSRAIPIVANWIRNMDDVNVDSICVRLKHEALREGIREGCAITIGR